jgi:hypothetical protein
LNSHEQIIFTSMAAIEAAYIPCTSHRFRDGTVLYGHGEVRGCLSAKKMQILGRGKTDQFGTGLKAVF